MGRVNMFKKCHFKFSIGSVKINKVHLLFDIPVSVAVLHYTINYIIINDISLLYFEQYWWLDSLISYKRKYRQIKKILR